MKIVAGTIVIAAVYLAGCQSSGPGDAGSADGPDGASADARRDEGAVSDGGSGSDLDDAGDESDTRVDAGVDAGDAPAGDAPTDDAPGGDAPGGDATAGDVADPCKGVAIPSGPADVERSVPGFLNRPYDIHVPPGYDCTAPAPVLLVLHGGGSNKDETHELTCPEADPDQPDCLDAIADREGFLAVYPNGSGRPIAPETRTFNAGGGSDGWVCVSGYACTSAFDDVAYVGALLDDLGVAVAVDATRVHATGISNGAAMSHRLACELSDRIAAIAPIAGGNQLSTLAPCTPGRPVPVVAFHGNEDAGWPYLGGPGKLPLAGDFKSIPETMAQWAARNGCDPAPDETTLPDIAEDGTTVRRHRYSNCDEGGDVVLYEIIGGGHTWPGGYQYAPVESAGRTTRDINAVEVMWSFLRDLHR